MFQIATDDGRQGARGAGVASKVGNGDRDLVGTGAGDFNGEFSLGGRLRQRENGKDAIRLKPRKGSGIYA